MQLAKCDLNKRKCPIYSFRSANLYRLVSLVISYEISHIWRAAGIISVWLLVTNLSEKVNFIRPKNKERKKLRPNNQTEELSPSSAEYRETDSSSQWLPQAYGSLLTMGLGIYCSSIFSHRQYVGGEHLCRWRTKFFWCVK